MHLSNFVKIRNCPETLSKLVTIALAAAGIVLLVLPYGCTSFSPGAQAVVPHPIRGERGLYVPPDKIGEKDFIAFYVLYTQAYGMEHKNSEPHAALALYQQAAKYKSTVINPEDMEAVEVKIAELRSKITSEN